MNKDSLTIRFLYKTALGRLLLKPLAHPETSKLVGGLMSTRLSSLFIPFFIRKHKISMKGVEIPEGGFSSFNAFFTRKRKSPRIDTDPDRLSSPCDGFLTIYDITEDSVFSIKNTLFSVDTLLKNKKLSAKYRGGLALIFRLTPANYHRYCYPADGTIVYEKKIPGRLYCVRPTAIYEQPVFIENAREYQVIRSGYFGHIVQMEVGATLVGKIHNHVSAPVGREVKAGQEKGYFEFGGSTVILLFKKDTLNLSKYFRKTIGSSIETPVRFGQTISC